MAGGLDEIPFKSLLQHTLLLLYAGAFEMGLSKLHGMTLLFTQGTSNLVIVNVLLGMDLSTLHSDVLQSH